MKITPIYTTLVIEQDSYSRVGNDNYLLFILHYYYPLNYNDYNGNRKLCRNVNK